MTPAERNRLAAIERRGFFFPDARELGRAMQRIDRRHTMEARGVWILFRGADVIGVRVEGDEPGVAEAAAAAMVSLQHATHAQLWRPGAGRVRELPEALRDPPLVGGGQGRDAGELRGSAAVVAVCLALAFAATLLALGWRLVA